MVPYPTGFVMGGDGGGIHLSLLIPAMDQSEEMGKFAFIPAKKPGFWGGILFLLLLDPSSRICTGTKVSVQRDQRADCERTTMMELTVTLA